MYNKLVNIANVTFYAMQSPAAEGFVVDKEAFKDLISCDLGDVLVLFDLDNFRKNVDGKQKKSN